MKAGPQRIGVIPFGDIPHLVLNVIAAHLSGYLRLEASVLPSIRNPARALDQQRLQYDVGIILQDLESRHFASVDKVIGILDVDIFVPVFSHVYGEARQGGDAALMSLFRLPDGLPGADTTSAKVLERAAKIALHEVCHLYNLTHCEDHRCLMHFSGNIADLDRLPLGFCRYCRRYLREVLHLLRGTG